ncbi:hypothetical protein HYE36_00825 [Mycoplasmopsis bovis]|nr:hypothetical protein [Mycoplasmopsis bovis]WHL49911.1 hypothetical protein HYE36_00825 [Mycoplasmopsis bovis]
MNNPYVSWFRNKWLPHLLKAIEYKKSKDPDWNFDNIPIYAIETDMYKYKNIFARRWILGSQEPRTSVQHVYFYKKDPEAYLFIYKLFKICRVRGIFNTFTRLSCL